MDKYIKLIPFVFKENCGLTEVEMASFISYHYEEIINNVKVIDSIPLSDLMEMSKVIVLEDAKRLKAEEKENSRKLTKGERKIMRIGVVAKEKKPITQVYQSWGR